MHYFLFRCGDKHTVGTGNHLQAYMWLAYLELGEIKGTCEMKKVQSCTDSFDIEEELVKLVTAKKEDALNENN